MAPPKKPIHRDRSNNLVPGRATLTSEAGNFPFVSGLINSTESHPWRKPKHSVPTISDAARLTHGKSKKFYDMEGMYVPNTAEDNEKEYRRGTN